MVVCFWKYCKSFDQSVAVCNGQWGEHGAAEFGPKTSKRESSIVKNCHETPPDSEGSFFLMFQCFFFFLIVAFFCLSFSSLHLLLDIFKPRMAHPDEALGVFFSLRSLGSRSVLVQVPELLFFPENRGVRGKWATGCTPGPFGPGAPERPQKVSLDTLEQPRLAPVTTLGLTLRSKRPNLGTLRRQARKDYLLLRTFRFSGENRNSGTCTRTIRDPEGPECLLTGW